MPEKITIGCPLCQNSARLIWDKPDFTFLQFPLLKPLPKIPTLPLNLYYCDKCVHAFLNPLPSEEAINYFYKKQYSYYTSPVKSGGLTTKITEVPLQYMESEIKKRFGTKEISVVDVGGNDGYTLKKIKIKTNRKVLIEPSKAAIEIAKNENIEICNDFLNNNTATQYANKFDVVITRHVIEHISDPKEFFANLLKLLKPNGLIFIETPDLLSVLKRTLLRVVSLQHLHYFSPISLEKIADKKAYLASHITAEGYAIVATFCKEKSPQSLPKKRINKKSYLNYAVTFNDRFTNECTKKLKLLKNWKNKGKKIWLWGAGSAANEIEHVYNLDLNLFTGIIDADPSKTQLHLPLAPSLSIYSPTEAFKMGVDSVLVTTYSVQEVLDKIQTFNPSVKVLSLYDSK